LGKNLKSPIPINLYINPTNDDGLDKGFVEKAIWDSAMEWESHTKATLFGTFTEDYDADWDSTPDGHDELSFGDYGHTGVIAVTRYWIASVGKIKQIKEFDIMFDTYWTWGDATNQLTPNVMDLQNIATHELGHGLGLSDLYTNACYSQTMYGYSFEGDTDGRTIESGDIKGLQTLYGS
jgi:hypothetical protein